MSQRNEAIQIGKGILLVFGMHVAALTIAIIAGYVLYLLLILLPSISFIRSLTYYVSNGMGFAFLGIGLTQAIYVVPAIVVQRRRQQWGLMKGVIVGAVITALLNGGCWLLLASTIK